MARLLNIKPRKVTPLFLLAFLEIAGHSLVSKYGEQGAKLIHYIIEIIIPAIPKTAIASTTKLQLFLDETIIKTGSFPIPSGRNLEP
jgi:hypothetical protein